jgi:hypothetical protein
MTTLASTFQRIGPANFHRVRAMRHPPRPKLCFVNDQRSVICQARMRFVWN